MYSASNECHFNATSMHKNQTKADISHYYDLASCQTSNENPKPKKSLRS